MIYSEIQLRAYFLPWILFDVQREIVQSSSLPLLYQKTVWRSMSNLKMEYTIQKSHLLQEELDMEE